MGMNHTVDSTKSTTLVSGNSTCASRRLPPTVICVRWMYTVHGGASRRHQPPPPHSSTRSVSVPRASTLHPTRRRRQHRQRGAASHAYLLYGGEERQRGVRVAHGVGEVHIQPRGEQHQPKHDVAQPQQKAVEREQRLYLVQPQLLHEKHVVQQPRAQLAAAVKAHKVVPDTHVPARTGQTPSSTPQPHGWTRDYDGTVRQSSNLAYERGGAYAARMKHTMDSAWCASICTLYVSVWSLSSVTGTCARLPPTYNTANQ